LTPEKKDEWFGVTSNDKNLCHLAKFSILHPNNTVIVEFKSLDMSYIKETIKNYPQVVFKVKDDRGNTVDLTYDVPKGDLKLINLLMILFGGVF